MPTSQLLRIFMPARLLAIEVIAPTRRLHELSNRVIPILIISEGCIGVNNVPRAVPIQHEAGPAVIEHHIADDETAVDFARNDNTVLYSGFRMPCCRPSPIDVNGRAGPFRRRRCSCTRCRA